MLDHLYIFSGEKCLFKSFVHFWIRLFLLLSCRSSFYILDITHLSDMWFANVFSQSFYPFSRAFCRAKFLILVKSNLFFYFYIFIDHELVSASGAYSLITKYRVMYWLFDIWVWVNFFLTTFWAKISSSVNTTYFVRSICYWYSPSLPQCPQLGIGIN